MKQRIKCPWCDGQVLRDDEHLTVGHSVPECEGFLAALRSVPRADRVTLDVVDQDTNQTIASFAKR